MTEVTTQQEIPAQETPATVAAKRPKPAYLKMKPERIQLFIDRHPGWSLDARGALTRSYSFTSLQTATAYAHYVAEVSRELGRGPNLQITGAELTLTLGVDDSLSEGDLAVAAAIHRAG